MAFLKEFSAVLGLVAMLSGPALSATCSGVSMPDSLESGDHTLVLNGMGVRLAPFLGFEVYVAGLYLAERSTDPKSIIAEDQPRHLVLHFLLDVNERSIKSAMQRSLNKNAGDRIETLKEPIDQFQGALSDFKQGQNLAFDYLPGRGTTITLDGATKAHIEGAEFASALISIWLGNPPNLELKTGLLGGRCS